jgi:hypothetical protein
VRHATKRPPAQTAGPSATAAQADTGGTPAWRRRAGLPVDTGTDQSGAAAGFFTGAATGFMLGGFRHY